MRVLLDCTLQTIGGGIQVALAILENAARTPEHEWHAAVSPQVYAEISGETLVAMKSVLTFDSGSRMSKLKTSRALGTLEQHLQPDVVFTIFGPALWRSKAPHVQGFALPNVIYPEVLIPGMTSSRRLRRGLDHFGRKMLMRRADVLVVETQTVRDRVAKVVGFPDQRIAVVPNSFSEMFRQSWSDRPRREKTGAFRFLVPSSYYHHKNLEFIPQVAKELKSLVRDPVEFLFTIRVDDPAWEVIHSVGERAGLNGSIRTLGHVPHAQIAHAYSRADAVFLPTLLECSSAVYPETFAAGLPLITTDRDFARELCQDGALYVDPTDARQAASVLASVVRDRSLRYAITARGARVLERNYISPKEKWERQLQVLIEAARNSKECKCH